MASNRREAVSGSIDRHILEFLKSSNQGFAIRQGDRLVFVNQVFADLCGYESPQAVLSLGSSLHLLAESERERISRYQVARDMGAEAPAFYELQAIRKDGAIWWAENRVQDVAWNGEPAVMITVNDITERREAENARHRDEAKFRSLLEESELGVAIRRDDKMVFANQAYADVFGYDSPQDIYKLDSFEKLVAREDRKFMRHLIGGDETGHDRLDNYEVRGRRLDGSTFWLENRVQRVVWEGRSASLAFVTDISDRKRAERRLYESEQRFRSLLEGSIQGVVVHRGMELLFANEESAKILGYDNLDEAVSAGPIEQHYHPDERVRVKGYALARLRGEPVPSTYEARALRKDGSTAWLEIRVTVVEWDRKPAIQSVFHDVTDRKRAEEAKEISEQRFRSLVESSIQGIVVHRNHKVILANQAMAKILGYDGPEPLYELETIDDYVHPDDIERTRTYRVQRTEGKEAPEDYELRVLRQDGSACWVECRAMIVDWDGETAIQSIFSDISERKHAEEALRASEGLYRSIIDNMQDTYYRADRDGRVAMVSPSVTELLGYSVDEFVGVYIANLYTDPADYERFLSDLKESNGLLQNYVTRICRRDGSVILTSTNVRYRRDGDGHVTGVEGTTRDITATKEAEDAARKSEARAEANQTLLLDAIESLSEGFVLFDSDDRLVMTNQRFLDFYESVADLWVVGAKSVDIARGIAESGLIAEARDNTEAWLRERLAHHRDSSSPIERRLGSDRYLLIDERKTSDGGTVSVVTDITKLKQAENELTTLNRDLERRVEERTKELQESEERLRIIMDGTVDGIIVIDGAGVVESFSRSAARMFGYEAPEIIGTKIDVLMPEPYGSRHGDYISRYLTTGEARILGKEREVRGQRKDGSTFTMEIAVSEVGFGGNRLFTALVRDITERKRVEQDLISAWKAADAANRAKSEFLSSMSHELRTPLNAILGFAQLQRDYSDQPLSDEQRVSIEQILEAGQHLLTLIDDVLDLSKIESGNIELLLGPFDPAQLIQESLKLVTPIADKRGVSLVVERSTPPGVQAMADSSRLKQVLLNLLSNAVKYNREGGTVTLDVVVTDANMLCISISDTGMGIPADKHDEVFRPFSRLGMEASTIEGTGVGLTISRQLIESMDGSLDFQSTIDEGSTFWFEVPIAEPKS